MSYSVMLVDNESVISNGLLHLIDWAAYDCIVQAVSCDGADAIRQIQKIKPDIVITDIRMPEVDGLQLCSWIREHFPSTQLILLTGFPCFEYAQQAIQYQVVDFVLKPTTEKALSEAIQKAIQRLARESAQSEDPQKRQLEQQMLLSELIFSNRHSLLFILTRLHELKIDLSHYYVMNLDVSAQGNVPSISNLLRQTQEVLRKCCAPRQLYFIPKSDNNCYAVLNLTSDEDPAVFCHQLVKWADIETDFVLTIGISRCHSEPLQLQKAAQESDDAQKFALYSSQPSVMRCEDLPPLSGDIAHILLEKLRLVESSLENCSREATLKNFDAFFDFVRVSMLPFSTVQQLAQMLYNFCSGLLFSYNLTTNDLPLPIQQLRSDTLDALEEELRDILLKTLSRIHQTPNNIDSIIYEIKQFIDQNYSASLSLDTLAARVHLSPSYFSKLFKREMGENLTTYISNLRIEHAKLLLRTTDKKTYEIAEAVGIYDPVYFSKLFKKITGLKPKDYRIQNKKEKG